MKKLIFLSLTLLIFCSLKAQTTQEEYNYVTIGYKKSLTDGSDFKRGYGRRAGYTSATFDKGGGQIRKFHVWHLYKESNPKKTVAMMLVLVDNNNGVDWVFCVPSGDAPSNIWDQFWTELYGSSPGIKNAVIRELSKMMMNNLKTLESK